MSQTPAPPRLNWSIAAQQTPPVFLQPLTCRYARLRNFRVAPFRRPYWLLYWSPCTNTVFQFGATRVRTHPELVLLLPYETAYTACMETPLEDVPEQAHHCVDTDADAAESEALIASGHLLLFTLSFRLDDSWSRSPPGIHPLTLAALGLDSGRDLVRAARPIAHRFSPVESLTLSALAARALAALPAEVLPVEPLSPALARVLAAIDENMESNLSNCDLAALAGLSSVSLARLTRTELGLSPRELLRHKRVERARRLLVSSDESIDAVADSCGFCDRYHFSKVFKRLEGLAPAAYRCLGRGSGR